MERLCNLQLILYLCDFCGTGSSQQKSINNKDDRVRISVIGERRLVERVIYDYSKKTVLSVCSKADCLLKKKNIPM